MCRANAALTEDVATITRPAKRQIRFVNAAGTLKDALIGNQAVCNIFDISSPKNVASDRILSHLSFELPVKSFVAFSSIAALMHPSGSSIYAAANYAMENILSLSHLMGIESLSIQWGAWAGIGMVSGSMRVAKAMDALNVSLISPLQGMYAFEYFMSPRAFKNSLYSCIPFRDTNRFLLVKTVNRESNKASKDTAGLIQNSITLTVESVAKTIQQCVSSLLDTTIDNLSQSLVQFGADSLCATEIQMALSKEFGINLPSTFMFDYPNILAMADMIITHLGAKSQAVNFDEKVLNHETLGEIYSPLIIESIMIRKPDGLSKLGLETLDCTKIVDVERWDPDFSAITYVNTRFGKFLADVKLFDAESFSITPREVMLMDPQQRLLLEVRESHISDP